MPVTISVEEPVVAELVVVTVSVDDPLPATDTGLKDPVAPVPKPVEVRFTVPVKPFTAVTVTV